MNIQKSALNTSTQEKEKRVRKYRNLGVFLLIGPFIGLILLLCLYAITSFIITASRPLSVVPEKYHLVEIVYAAELLPMEPIIDPPTHKSLEDTIGPVVNIGLSLLGIFFILWFFFGIPLGIYFLIKSSREKRK